MKDIAARRGPSNMADSGTASVQSLKLSVSMDGLLPVLIQAVAGLAEGQARLDGKLDRLIELLQEPDGAEQADTSLDDRGGGWIESSVRPLS